MMIRNSIRCICFERSWNLKQKEQSVSVSSEVVFTYMLILWDFLRAAPAEVAIIDICHDVTTGGPGVALP
jgi:hypothetical protein